MLDSIRKFSAKPQPIQVLVVYLFALLLCASASFGGSDLIFWITQIAYAMLLFGGMFLGASLLPFFKISTKTRLENRLISGCIWMLLFDPTFPWWSFLLGGALVEVIQRVIRIRTGPLLNPVAIAAVPLILLGIIPGWWGVSFAPRFGPWSTSFAMLLTVPVGVYIITKYKKWWIVGSMVVVFSTLYLLLFQLSPLFFLLEGTLAFFLSVMAIEPKTSPVLRRDQILYGAVLGVLFPVLLKMAFIESWIGSLLIANLAWNGWRWYDLRQKLQKAQARVAPSSGNVKQ